MTLVTACDEGRKHSIDNSADYDAKQPVRWRNFQGTSGHPRHVWWSGTCSLRTTFRQLCSAP
jgi:hypothetical protein